MATVRNLQSFVKKSETIIKRSEQAKRETTVLVCTGGGCIASGSLEIVEAFKSAIQAAGLTHKVVGTGCMGPCSKGPVVRIEPENCIYQNLSVQDVERVVSEHLVGGTPVQDLLLTDDHPEKIIHEEKESAFLGPQRKVVLRNCGLIDPLDIEAYIGRRGYQGLVKVLSGMTSGQIIWELKESCLKGR